MNHPVDYPPLHFLSLRNNSISSNFPGSLLESLGALTHLDLSMNQITGDITYEVSQLDLSYLFLGDTKLNAAGGTIPDHLYSLTNLRELSLRNLGLQGTFPQWLETFYKLKLLDLSDNRLTGSIDLDFQRFDDLVFLLLHGNQLTGALPQSLDKLDNLGKLQTALLWQHLLSSSSSSSSC
jgi:Leucine-rich repeat (LRR) protein